MITIRPVIYSDISSLKLIRSENLSDEIINQRLSDQNKGDSEFLIIEVDGQIIGFVVLKWTGKETHPEYPDMGDLYIKDSERGKGFGTALIQECENKAKNKGFKKTGLAVNPDLNANAKRLYEKLDYKVISDKPYLDGIYNGVEDWVVDLEKDLSS
ncbi:MAG: GNAT family N-acetyltransferase [Candidatus Shapirobacteria bacterium]